MNDSQDPPRAAWAPLVLFGLAVGVFVAAFVASRAVPESVTARAAWARQAVAQGITTAFALGAMALSRRPWAEFGFRRPAPEPTPGRGWFKLCGFLLGIAGTLGILALGLRGMQGRMAAYGLPGIVFWVWGVSSITEEIFCRGWFQTVVDDDAGAADSPRGRHAVAWSAALFGSLHLTLLRSDVEFVAVLIILASVTALGYVCALARARTGSLRPAILAHVLFNVGGLVGGVIYTVGYRVATGHMPTL